MANDQPQGPRLALQRPIQATLLAGWLALVSCGQGSEETDEPELPTGVPAMALPADVELLDPAVRKLIDEHAARLREVPGKGGPYGSLGLVYEANGLWREALASFQSARELAPGNPTWHLHTAIAQQKLGQLDAAWQSLSEGVEAHPDSAPIWCWLGDLALERGDAARAREAYERARSLNPKASEPWVGLGELDLAAGEVEGAVAQLERAVELDDSYRAAHYLLGSAYRSAGRMEDAARELKLGVSGKRRGMLDAGSRKLSRFAAGSSQIVGRSRRLLARGRWQEAADLLEPIVLGTSDNARLHLNLGIAWFNLGRPQDALRVLEDAARLDPTQHMVPFNQAAFHLTLEQPEAALAATETALELDPEFAPSHHLRGRAFLALERLEEAEAALGDARRRAPQDASIRQSVGELAQARGEPDAAREHFVAASGLAPGDPGPLVALARLEQAAGDQASALEALKKARALSPEHPDVTALEQELDQ